MSAPLRVAALTAGRNVPAARFRVRQFIEPLRRFDIAVTEDFPALGAYPPRGKPLRPLWAAGSLLQRLPAIARTHQSDVTLFQRELLSTYVTLESLARHPRVLDVDDAIWMHPRGSFAGRLARMVDLVICGNDFLAENFARWNPRVAVVPTAVDTTRFVPAPPEARPTRPVIGWIGTEPGHVHLAMIIPAVRAVLHAHPDAVLRIVTDADFDIPGGPDPQIQVVRWSAEEEMRQFHGMTIGLMPLLDDEFSRGKCSYKMLLSMACGLPVVVSPVGMNKDVLARGTVGFGATTYDEWVAALHSLLADPPACAALGREGRSVVEQFYSIDAVAPLLAAQLVAAAGRPA